MFIYFTRYAAQNETSDPKLRRRFNKSVPDFLHDKPTYFVNHCKKKMILATKEFNETMITHIRDNLVYTVSTGKCYCIT